MFYAQKNYLVRKFYWIFRSKLLSLYSAIPEGRSIFCEVIALVIMEESLFEYVSNSNGYQDRAVWIFRPNCIRYFCGDTWRRKVKTERWIEEKNCLLAFLLLVTAWRNVKINSEKNTRYLHTNCKVRLGLLWDLWTFIVNCNKFVISA